LFFALAKVDSRSRRVILGSVFFSSSRSGWYLHDRDSLICPVIIKYSISEVSSILAYLELWRSDLGDFHHMDGGKCSLLGFDFIL